MKEEIVNYNCSYCIHYNNKQCKQTNCIPNKDLDLTKIDWRNLFIPKKEETIEEAAKEYAHFYPTDPDKFAILEIDAFKAGATWQKEQDSKVMYTEEEVTNLFVDWFDALAATQYNSLNFIKWFNLNKK